MANEIIWIKAYSFSGMLHAPMELSKVVYVELIDGNNVTVIQSKVEMLRGKGNGSLEISSLPTATYRLRAYTRWMMNYKEDYFFEREIQVFNTQSAPFVKPVTQGSMIHADFYPEGGSLVEGLTSTVAFRITDASGRGVQASGKVVDQNDVVVGTFTPLTLGIGRFRFLPQTGFQYKVIITYNGKETSHALPEIASTGYTMEVTADRDKYVVSVSRKAPVVQSDYLMLLVHTRQHVKLVSVSFFKEDKVVFTIDKNKLGDGISHITLFDRLKNPVAERLVFKKPTRQLTIEGVPQAYQYAPREEVKVSIRTTDDQQVPVAANMSFAIYALDSLQDSFSTMGMLSYAYLVSDLGDRIEQPEFYFSKDTVSVTAIDNLMLTYGWRKFDWKQVVNGNASPLVYAPEYEGLTISGRVRDEVSGTFMNHAKVFLSVAGVNPVFGVTRTDKDGKFQFTVSELYGTKPVVFQAGGGSIQLNNSFDTRFGKGTNYDAYVPWKVANQTLTLNNIHAQVERTFHGFDHFLDKLPDTTRFYGKPTISYLLDDYVRFPTLEDVFREYVPGVIVRRHDKKGRVYVLNNASQLFFEEEPLILLDGVPVRDTDVLLGTDASAVKEVNIVNVSYHIGPVAFSGILDIRTYKGNLGEFDIDPNAVVIDYEGLNRMRIFKSPEYPTIERKYSRIPDFRSVLYWQPDVDTDADGNQTVNFYTSDKRGNFMGVINGMTKNGLIGFRTFMITVK